jgi:hypothetical protein
MSFPFGMAGLANCIFKGPPMESFFRPNHNRAVACKSHPGIRQYDILGIRPE